MKLTEARRNWMIGKRVVLNDVWKQQSGGIGPQGRKGTIVGLSRQKDCVRVQFDECETPSTFHASFFDMESW